MVWIGESDDSGSYNHKATTIADATYHPKIKRDVTGASSITVEVLRYDASFTLDSETRGRCLRHLLSVAGSDPKLTLVVADGKPDGSLDEVRDLAALYGVKYIGHDSGGSNVTIRIQRHYKFAFDSAFHTFPWARKVIVLEEDLRVSPDFFSDSTIFIQI
ncbi:protein O-linked-mannose beta-1,2-N-acetylglucosaminyltransferase 1-like [Penaeus japonicus]|uniref:protein O-linked-mannose beta-1,2-N-acetylglucosaminyltransferase 1-like n=1 Tax=Penaeus japonicus TaxID=27405 RepID=UPI001C712986|nr:protein O-linked-mannose beta-1,2-N-acetylglucosaminyltransferase 1-like [Penaeus japonicus]